MKKLVSLLCTMLFMGALASYAACPCNPPAPCCEKPKPCCETPAPCCETPCPCPQPKCCDDKSKCDCVPNETVIKEESCCYPMSQTELFKKVGMDQCQMDKACCLFEKFKCDTAPIKDRLNCEKAKLCEMIKCGASKCEINAQKDKIKCLKKDIKAKWECYEDGLKCLLNKCQLKEYKKIKKEQNKKYKKLFKSNCCCKSTK